MSILKKLGYETGIDIKRLMDIGERLIRPMLTEKGFTPINVTSGYAGFHSGYLGAILKHSETYELDPRDLIEAVCEVDMVHAPDDMIEKLAKKIKRASSGSDGSHYAHFPGINIYEELYNSDTDQSLSSASRRLALKIKSTARKGGKGGVVNIVAVPAADRPASVSRFVQEDFDFVIGGVEAGTAGQLKEVVATVDGLVDYLLVDSSMKPYMDRTLSNLALSLAKESKVIAYNDDAVWVRAVDHQLGVMLDSVAGKRVVVFGLDRLALKLIRSLADQGAQVVLTGDKPGQVEAFVRSLEDQAGHRLMLIIEPQPAVAVREAAALVAFALEGSAINVELIKVASPKMVIFDATIGAVSKEAAAYAV